MVQARRAVNILAGSGDSLYGQSGPVSKSPTHGLAPRPDEQGRPIDHPLGEGSAQQTQGLDEVAAGRLDRRRKLTWDSRFKVDKLTINVYNFILN